VKELGEKLKGAETAGIITSDQQEQLKTFLSQPEPELQQPKTADIDSAEIMEFIGFLVMMVAAWYLMDAVVAIGGYIQAATAIVYAIIFGGIGHYVWTKRGDRVDGSVGLGIAVLMMPLAIYGLQDALGMWGKVDEVRTAVSFSSWIESGWVLMELATIIAAVVALVFYRSSLLISILVIAVWLMCVDTLRWFTGADWSNLETVQHVAIPFGLVVIFAAVIVNLRQKTGDHARWLYIYGVTMFWVGITFPPNSFEINLVTYCVLNVVLLLLGVFLGRSVFAMLGVVGIAFFLLDLVEKFCADSPSSLVAMALIGLCILVFGLYSRRYHVEIGSLLNRKLPAPFRRIRHGSPGLDG